VWRGANGVAGENGRDLQLAQIIQPLSNGPPVDPPANPIAAGPRQRYSRPVRTGNPNVMADLCGGANQLSDTS